MEKRAIKKDALVSFLYVLMRDHLTPGAVEGLFEKHIKKTNPGEIVFTNCYLADHAIDLAERIRE